MKEKTLGNIISTSPLALLYPQLAYACISEDITADMFSKIHECVMGEHIDVNAKASEGSEEGTDVESLLLSIPSH